MDSNFGHPYLYEINLGGIKLFYALQYPETAGYLGSYAKETVHKAKDWLLVRDYEFEEWKQLSGKENIYGEYNLLPLQTSEALFKHQRFIFHSVAFRRKDKAWY